MIRLIASDLDGTLLPEACQELSPRTRSLIAQILEKGIHFVVASGREYKNELLIFEGLEDKISFIAQNGSLCVHEGKVISQTVMAPELVHKIVSELEKNDRFEPILSASDSYYTTPANTKFIQMFSDAMPVHVLENLHQVDVPIMKVALSNTTGEPELVIPYLEHLREVFGDEVKIVTSGSEWIDFLAPGATKGIALQKLTALLGIQPEECIAFGDQQNDIEMLKFAGTSYAMKTCAPGVAEHADATIDCVEDVLEALLKTL